MPILHNWCRVGPEQQQQYRLALDFNNALNENVIITNLCKAKTIDWDYDIGNNKTDAMACVHKMWKQTSQTNWICGDEWWPLACARNKNWVNDQKILDNYYRLVEKRGPFTLSNWPHMGCTAMLLRSSEDLSIMHIKVTYGICHIQTAI